jgi:hypothetical protein
MFHDNDTATGLLKPAAADEGVQPTKLPSCNQ